MRVHRSVLQTQASDAQDITPQDQRCRRMVAPGCILKSRGLSERFYQLQSPNEKSGVEIHQMHVSGESQILFVGYFSKEAVLAF